MTIQPNTAFGAPILVKTDPGDSTPEAKVWALVSHLSYQLDKLRTGCPNPGMLGERDRLQGYGVLEARNGNIHAHILYTCADRLDQALTGLFLFEHLDTVSRVRDDARDEAWQKDNWRFLQDRKGPDFRRRTSSPLLHRHAPGATGMVQLVRDEHDRHRVTKYFTKELRRSTLALASKSQYWDDRSDLHIRELREFHSKGGYEKPARAIHIVPETGAQILDMDHRYPWKRNGRRIR